MDREPRSGAHAPTLPRGGQSPSAAIASAADLYSRSGSF
jgi:hypothetical protein